MKCTECVQGLKKVTNEFCTTCNGRGGWDDGDLLPTDAPVAAPEGIVAKAVKAVKKAVKKAK